MVGFMNVTFILGDGLNWFQFGFYLLLIWGGASQFDSPFFLNNIFQYRVEIATYFKVSGLSTCLLWHLICQKHRFFEFDHDLPKTLRTPCVRTTRGQGKFTTYMEAEMSNLKESLNLLTGMHLTRSSSHLVTFCILFFCLSSLGKEMLHKFITHCVENANILLMEEILHQLIWQIHHYMFTFFVIHPNGG